MQTVRRFRKAVALIMALNIFGINLVTGVAQAAMISTADVAQAGQVAADRAQVMQLLDQTQVRDQLVALGVDPELAKERVQNMTDEELMQINEQLSELPAGGDALGILLTIFIVFVITDVIGATDIFPFINSVN